MASTRSTCFSAVHPGTKNVAFRSSSLRSSSIFGTPVLAPYAPCDSTPGRRALSGSRDSHSVSASKSNVSMTAQRAPFGHGNGVISFIEASSRCVADGCLGTEGKRLKIRLARLTVGRVEDTFLEIEHDCGHRDHSLGLWQGRIGVAADRSGCRKMIGHAFAQDVEVDPAQFGAQQALEARPPVKGVGRDTLHL